MSDFKPIRLDPNVLQLATSCSECWVRVTHADRDDDNDFKWVQVLLFSPHVARARVMWLGRGGRLDRAWQALRGETEPWLDFYSRAEVDGLREALDEAGRIAFSDA